MSKGKLGKFTLLGDVKYQDVQALTNHGDDYILSGQISKAPTGVAVIGRVMQLTSEFIGGIRLKHKEAIWVAAEELSESGALYPATQPKLLLWGTLGNSFLMIPRLGQGVPADEHR